MGNSRKTQAGRGSSESLASQTVAPDTIARPTVQAKHPCTSSLTASLTSRPPSPSYGQYPGRISVEDEDVVFHDASDPTLAGSICISAPSSVPAKQPQRTSGLQQAPLSAPDLETTLFEGDVFYDAATHFTAAEPIVHPATLKPQRASGLQQAPEPCVEGASKGRMNVAPPRSGRSTTPATSNANYYFPAPGRGSSRPAASSVAAAPPAPALGAQPLPSLPSGSIFNPVSGPSKKALLVGIDYLGSKQPLKHATRDATKLGKVLSDVLQFSDENLVFVTDQVRNNTSSCFAPSVRRNHGAATGRSLFGGAPGWKGLVHTEDKKQFVQSSRHNLIEGFRWLVRGAKSGDDLFMLFSGHCAYYNGEGPYIITTGNGGVEDFVSKKDLHEELVLKIPKGCRLHIILDCCNSAALFDLQYCVGSMRPDSDDEPSKDGLCLEVAPPEEACLEEPAAHHITLKSIQAPALVSAPVCEPTTSMCDLSTSSGPERHVPIHGSLYGVSQAVLPADPLPPGSFGEETFASSTVPHRAVKRPGGVVAAPPPANSGPSAITTTGASAAATATSWFTWAKDMVVPSSAPAPAPAAVAEDVKPAAIPNQSAEVRRARNLVAEAPRPIDYFKERKEGYVTPDGEVIIFAAAGAHQPAFEASGGAKSGIVTGAFCKALQTCKDLTHRDLWVSVRGAVDSENKDRERRDLAKDADNRPDPKHRTQHAELWVSQGEPLYSAAPVLDKRAFGSVKDTASQSQVAAF